MSQVPQVTFNEARAMSRAFWVQLEVSPSLPSGRPSHWQSGLPQCHGLEPGWPDSESRLEEVGPTRRVSAGPVLEGPRKPASLVPADRSCLGSSARVGLVTLVWCRLNQAWGRPFRPEPVSVRRIRLGWALSRVAKVVAGLVSLRSRSGFSQAGAAAASPTFS